MDVFSMLGSSSGKSLNTKPRSANAGVMKLSGIVVRISEKSVLFFDDASGQEIFVPISRIMDWWFTSCGTKRGLRICDLELDDEITILMPTWLAKKEKLL